MRPSGRLGFLSSEFSAGLRAVVLFRLGTCAGRGVAVGGSCIWAQLAAVAWPRFAPGVILVVIALLRASFPLVAQFAILGRGAAARYAGFVGALGRSLTSPGMVMVN